MSVVLAIPDQHAPFMHQDAICFLKNIKKKHKPDSIVNLGDVADFHCASRFVKSSKNSGDDEMDNAIEQLGPLFDLFPDARVCIGNHCSRIADRIAEAGLPSRAIRSLAELLESPPGWKWADEHELDGVLYVHGTGYSGKDGHLKCAASNMQSTVMGHLHSFAGINFVANRKHLVFGCNAGCLIDFHAYAFDYARRGNKPILSCVLVTDGVPQLIPMPLNTNGRLARSER